MKIKGMWLDSEKQDQPENTTRINKNIVRNKTGSLSNEEGVTYIDEPEAVVENVRNIINIGVIVLSRNRTVRFVIRKGLCSIELLDENDKVKTIIENNCLNFSETHPIHGVYHDTQDGETIVVYTDGLNPLKTVNVSKTYTSCESFNLINEATSPILNSIEQIENSGSLPTGSYIPIFQFEKQDGSVSDIFKSYVPVTLSKDSIFNLDPSGNDPSQNTNKAIRLSISYPESVNIYRYIKVGLILNIDGVITAAFYKTVDIIKDNNISLFTITGFEDKELLDLSEVLIDYANYKTVQHITSLNREFFGADIEKYKEGNAQNIISTANVKWCSKLIDIAEIKQGETRTFFHGEVYALYIRLHWSWGIGNWYTIPGREQIASDISATAETDVTPYWYDNDTCLVTNNTETGYAEGTMSFHENNTERYPDSCGFESITGNCITTDPVTGECVSPALVRHHKFPTSGFMCNYYKTVDSDGDKYGTSKLDKLGIVIDLDLLDITDCSGNKPLRYEIGYAKRTIGNSTTVGQSIHIEMTNASIDNDRMLSLGGNYNLGTAGFNLPTDSYNLRLYPFEILYSQTSTNISDARREYDLTTEPKGFSTSTKFEKKIAGADKISDSSYTLTDYTTTDSISSFVLADRILEVLLNFYVSNNTATESIDNLLQEAFQYINLNNPISSVKELIPIQKNYAYDRDGDLTGTNTLVSTSKEKTILMTLRKYKENLYENFFNQEIVTLGVQLKDNNNINQIKFYNADSFLCDYSLNIYGRSSNLTSNQEYTNANTDLKLNGLEEGLYSIKRFLCVSAYNINNRFDRKQELSGYTEYFPKSSAGTSDSFMKNWNKAIEPNSVYNGYSKHSHFLNTLAISSIYTDNLLESNLDNSNKFAIIRTREFDIDNNRWGNFRQNDIYTPETSRGFIVNLVSGKDFLYIHYEESLLKTAPTNRALVSSENIDEVILGSSDIFSIKPSEVIHDLLGRLGTKHKHSCIFTQVGYVFYDVDKTAWFIVGEKSIKVLTDNGVKNHFEKHGQSLEDIPYGAFDSVQSIYDDLKERIIVTHKTTNLIKENESFEGVWSKDDKKNKLLEEKLVVGSIIKKDGKFFRVVSKS